MSRPWANLPGPATLLEKILEDLTDGISVIAAFPDRNLSDSLAEEIADLFKCRRLGPWEGVHFTDKLKMDPKKCVDRKLNGRRGLTLWIDAIDETDTATAWADYVRNSIDEMHSTLRLCIVIATTDECADNCEDDKLLRRRRWSDFIGLLDARAIAEQFGRSSGHKPSNIALRSALVAELAGADLVRAEMLSEHSLRNLINDHSREKVWAAQVAVLFPLLERQRRWLLKKYQNLWEIPYERSKKKQIRCLEDLEFQDMVNQAQRLGRGQVDQRFLKWLRRVRNKLAHSEVVSWGLLTELDKNQVPDFLHFQEH